MLKYVSEYSVGRIRRFCRFCMPIPAFGYECSFMALGNVCREYPWFVDFLDGIDVTAPDIVNFNFYAEAFAAWLKQIETLNGREVFLINPAMFESNPARLTDKKLFAALDGNKTALTLHEIFYRLTEPFKYDSTVKGFGKFLRKLYDACNI